MPAIVTTPVTAYAGKVRVIDGGDNVHVGRDLLENNFYKTNRVLDQDQFLVRVDR
ncbi:hypothetical protein Acy02nite_56840 [Actinoplanes cyaneus]|uniref:Uncharacterized protein n=1 Tax=Actinoplanes cyaneus TaxID=52696 RepID=A0A919ILX2_9ACTN|nr:hypothetical protein [Actinoplanes cyaneus]MCW2139903.1 hypothetical protein [Actinoplanes cyaneus]GID67803.1 hypothetical protein Acy02nite_56840 [Actinoplanes cyaneus]